MTAILKQMQSKIKKAESIDFNSGLLREFDWHFALSNIQFEVQVIYMLQMLVTILTAGRMQLQQTCLIVGGVWLLKLLLVVGCHNK